MRIAVKAWRTRQALRVARRRAEFGPMASGFDERASLRLLRQGSLERDEQAALRTVLIGDVVSEVRASHWNPLPSC